MPTLRHQQKQETNFVVRFWVGVVAQENCLHDCGHCVLLDKSCILPSWPTYTVCKGQTPTLSLGTDQMNVVTFIVWSCCFVLKKEKLWNDSPLFFWNFPKPPLKIPYFEQERYWSYTWYIFHYVCWSENLIQNNYCDMKNVLMRKKCISFSVVTLKCPSLEIPSNCPIPKEATFCLCVIQWGSGGQQRCYSGTLTGVSNFPRSAPTSLLPHPSLTSSRSVTRTLELWPMAHQNTNIIWLFSYDRFSNSWWKTVLWSGCGPWSGVLPVLKLSARAHVSGLTYEVTEDKVHCGLREFISRLAPRKTTPPIFGTAITNCENLRAKWNKQPTVGWLGVKVTTGTKVVFAPHAGTRQRCSSVILLEGTWNEMSVYASSSLIITQWAVKGNKRCVTPPLCIFLATTFPLLMKVSVCISVCLRVFVFVCVCGGFPF